MEAANNMEIDDYSVGEVELQEGVSGDKEKNPSSPILNGKRVRKKNPKYTDNNNNNNNNNTNIENNSKTSSSVLTKRKKAAPTRRGTKRTKLDKNIPTESSQIKSLNDRKKELELQLQILNQDLTKVEQQLEQKKQEIGLGLSSTNLVDILPSETVDKYDYPTDNEEGEEDLPQPNGSSETTEAVVPTVPPPSRTSRGKTTKAAATPRATPKKRGATTARRGGGRTPARGGRATTEAVSTTPQSGIDSCKRILKTLMNHRYSFPFNEPVDIVALNIPDYPSIIKHPMDFGTIKKKLESDSDQGGYRAVSEFVSDVNLVFCNACTYNPPNSDVFIMAETLRDLFRKRMKPIEDREKESRPSHNQSVNTTPSSEPVEIGSPVSKIQSPPHNLRSATVTATAPTSPSPVTLPLAEKSTPPAKTPSGKSGKSEPKATEQKSLEMMDLKKSVDMIRQGLHMLMEQKSSTPTNPRKASTTKKKEPTEIVPMTKEEKRKLSMSINSLTGTHLAMVVKIIKAQVPTIDNAKEVVIDIDSLDPATLRALESYVGSVKKKRPKRRPKRAPAASGNLDENQASRLELAKKTELGTQKKMQDVQRRLQELSNKSAALNRSTPSVSGLLSPTSTGGDLTPSTLSDSEKTHPDKPADGEESSSESESESDSDSSGSESESESGSESDSESGSSSGSESESESSSDDDDSPAGVVPKEVAPKVETVIAPVLSAPKALAQPTTDSSKKPAIEADVPQIISASTTSEIQIDTIENADSWNVLAADTDSIMKESPKSPDASNLWCALRDNHALIKQKELEKQQREERLRREKELLEEERKREELDRKRVFEEEKRRKEKEEEEARLQREKEIEEARQKAKRDREMKLKGDIEDDISIHNFQMGSMASAMSNAGPALLGMIQNLKSPDSPVTKM